MLRQTPMRFPLLLLLTLLFFTTPLSAATLYVAPSGDDTAAGSIEKPLRSITRAAALAKPGDIVNVRGGTYRERVFITSRGTSEKRIVFRAVEGEQVVLDGSALARDEPIVELHDTEYVDLEGFEVLNSPSVGIVVWHATHTRLLNNHVHYTQRNGIYVGGDEFQSNSDITLSGNHVHETVLENRMRDMGDGGWAGAVVVSRTGGATIIGNRIWNNFGEGLISLRSDSALIRDNEIFDNFSANLYLDNARHVRVEHNTIYATGNRRFDRDGLPAAGIAIANETKDVMNPSSDIVITNNIVCGTRWGFYYGDYESGGGLRNTKVLHNEFIGTVEEIIRIEGEGHSDTEVAHNVFHQTGSPPPRLVGAGEVMFRNNVWHGESGAAAGENDRIVSRH